jgi:HEAT repeat protein
MKVVCNWVAVIIFILSTFGNAVGEQQNSIIKDIEEIISQGESASFTKLEAVKNKIEENPDKILPLLLKKANTPNLPETDLVIYIWAIGLTKSPKAVDDIIKLTSGKQSERLVGNAYKALATIGGERPGEYLFKKLRETSDPMMRFNLLDLLAQLQYKPALPGSIEILKLDPNQYYWQSIFVFGKYGDLAIPFLLEKINDPNKNIRSNSIMVLGQWLIAQEAVKAMKKQFGEESDPRIRAMILSSLEQVNSSLEDIKAFSQEVVRKERDDKVAQFANETVNNYEQMNDYLKSFKSKKKNDRSLFESEYKKIFSSFGKEGNYDNLGSTSTKADEEKPKRMKEIILQRNSDECFYDYQKINNIIMLNRLI